MNQTDVSPRRHLNPAAARRLSTQTYDKIGAQKAKELLGPVNREAEMAAEITYPKTPIARL